MMVGDPVSESQGGLEDVEECAFRPKVPKPPNRTALAANRTLALAAFLGWLSGQRSNTVECSALPSGFEPG